MLDICLLTSLRVPKPVTAENLQQRADVDGQVTQDVREFAMTYEPLLAFLTCFVEAHCLICGTGKHRGVLEAGVS